MPIWCAGELCKLCVIHQKLIVSLAWAFSKELFCTLPSQGKTSPKNSPGILQGGESEQNQTSKGSDSTDTVAKTKQAMAVKVIVLLKGSILRVRE